MPPKKKQDEPRPVPHIDPNSSFTPESFEKELKSLAAKAKEDTWARAAREQGAIYARIALYLTLAAASANASVAALSPVYGAIPAGVWHSTVVATALFVGWSSNLHLRRLLPARRPLVLWLPLLAVYVPAIQFVLTRYSSGGSPFSSTSNVFQARWGPLVIESLTTFPLVAATIACVANELEAAAGLDEVVRLPKWVGDALPGLGAWTAYKLAEGFTAREFVASGGGLSGLGSLGGLLALLHTRVARQLALAAAYALAAPSRLLWYAVPALLHALLLNTHLAGSPHALAATNRILARQTWTVLERRESLTGYLSVAENTNEGFRVLRCDHSLLGGEWTRAPASPVAEPIYGVFVMLEAVRLVESPNKALDKNANALVIGLGVGTAPAALVAHGIATTVVEIDPAVHALASRYFHLPANHTAVLEDAVAYTDRLVKLPFKDRPRYDYIIHDVFTGGAEPVPLFTLEFLQNLHRLLKLNGVIAINYAGDLGLTPIKAVVHTIKTVFPTCRIFREHSPDAVDEGEPDFANVVIFCNKNGKPLSFRDPEPADMLNSETRKRFLAPAYEVSDEDFKSPEPVRLVRRNDTVQLTKWHAATARGHWGVMRKVVPAKVWEMW